MPPTRRAFLKSAALGTAGLSALGFDLAPLHAQVRQLKIARTRATRCTCPYCSVSWGVIVHTLGDGSQNVKGTVVLEGDPDHPINRGTLCPKGVTLKHNVVNDRRLAKSCTARRGATIGRRGRGTGPSRLRFLSHEFGAITAAIAKGSFTRPGD